MTKVHRHALVRHSAARMFGLVNDVASYPRRFAWCEAAQVLEQSDTHMLARLELRVVKATGRPATRTSSRATMCVSLCSSTCEASHQAKRRG